MLGFTFRQKRERNIPEGVVAYVQTLHTLWMRDNRTQNSVQGATPPTSYKTYSIALLCIALGLSSIMGNGHQTYKCGTANSAPECSAL